MKRLAFNLSNNLRFKIIALRKPAGVNLMLFHVKRTGSLNYMVDFDFVTRGIKYCIF